LHLLGRRDLAAMSFLFSALISFFFVLYTHRYGHLEWLMWELDGDLEDV
jgi:hypothetical protein